MNVHVNVQNFGPIEKAKIDLRPLTVFVGESNTGKTYLAALIYALHQSFGVFSRLPWSHRIFLEQDARHRFSEERQEVAQEILAVREKLNTPGRPFKFSDLPQQLQTLLLSELMDPKNLTNELKRCFDLKSISKLIRFTGSKDNEIGISLRVFGEDQTYWDFRARDAGSGFTVGGHISSDMVLFNSGDETLDFGDLFARLYFTKCMAGYSYYLPAARSGIMQSHGVIVGSLIKRATRIGLDSETSTFSGMIADFLERIVRYDEHLASSEAVGNIAKELEDGLLGGEIEVKRPTPEAYREFLYRPGQAEEGLRMSHASAMVSELAPLVLFLRGIVKPGDLLIIEEPEAHLHPGAQTKIAQTLARLVRAGVRVLITTHSDWLLQQIGNLIREG